MMNLRKANRQLAVAVATVVFAAVTSVAVFFPAASVAGPPDAGRVRTAPLGYDGSLLVQLHVSDLDRAIAFYRDVLEFRLKLRNDDLAWAKMDTGIANVVVGLGVGEEVKGSGTLSMNFGVKDIAAARASLESRGVVFKGPTFTIPDVVKLADFTDPDGNRIRLAQGL